jgi:hypothetical protein
LASGQPCLEMAGPLWLALYLGRAGGGSCKAAGYHSARPSMRVKHALSDSYSYDQLTLLLDLLERFRPDRRAHHHLRAQANNQPIS